jgi:HlyD family secretion protein
MNALRAGLAVVAALALFGCAETPKTYQGWVEANLIFVAPDETGRVETLSVREGERVEKGAPLFTVDEDLQRADLRMNEALVENAQQAFDRAKLLLKSQAGTQKTYDDAEAALRTAQARLNTAQTRLTRRKVASPVTGTVQQVYFRPGEMTPAGRPVLAILPPGNLKLRFFVPEAVLPQIAYGELVKVHCDGCPDDITARVSFISRTAEFTPPVIYSLQERSKLVFLIEALPDNPEKLRVGQPIDVALGGSADAPAQAAQKGDQPLQGRTGKERDKGVGSWLRNWALSLLGADSEAPGNQE